MFRAAPSAIAPVHVSSLSPTHLSLILADIVYEALSEMLLSLSRHSVLWAVFVIVSMAVTAVVLYVFWDLVGRVVTLVRSLGRSGGISSNRSG